jgi:hypothetical protein
MDVKEKTVDHITIQDVGNEQFFFGHLKCLNFLFCDNAQIVLSIKKG